MTLTKKALSLYFRVGCERQFLLYLYNDEARRQFGMPPRQEGRAGLGLVGRAGFEWQATKVSELGDIFGQPQVVTSGRVRSNKQHEPVSLGSVIDGLTSYQFVVEAKFPAKTKVFRQAVGLSNMKDRHGLELDLGSLQPDLIQVLPPLAEHERDDPDLAPEHYEEVLPDGTTRAVDPAADSRRRLRVLDIKLTAEPGAHYFAEVVFYSMALAAWLEETGKADKFAVVAAPAVVPGSVDHSNLVEQVQRWRQSGHAPTLAERTTAFEEDLETAPVEAFAPRIRQVIDDVLPRLLQTRWDQTVYHVDYRCQGCEFLGDPHILDANRNPTQRPGHCWPLAASVDHLSRVVGLSKGAAEVLEDGQLGDVAALAQVAPTPQLSLPFQWHHGLKARRTVYPFRAQSLTQGTAMVIPDSGGDALMPNWPSLRINLFLDYDPATGMTAAFGCRAFWSEPLPYGSTLSRNKMTWDRNNGVEVFPVMKATPASEWKEFQKYLRHIRGIMETVRNQDVADVAAGRRNRPGGGKLDKKAAQSSYQIYLWDEAQHRHLVRLVSRYLPKILADSQLKDLAWLFPPPELLAHPETATRKTPFTLVHDVVNNTVALPEPHHYTLLNVVSGFNDTPVPSPTVHPQYRETFSNLIPPERIHELWQQKGNWAQTVGLIVETQQKKLLALGLVVQTLEGRLGKRLSRLSAPPIPTPPARPRGLAPVGHLWHEFTRLNAALESLDVHRTRAMPPHEREARFKSARLTRRLSGGARTQALKQLSAAAGRPLPSPQSLLVYKMGPDSTEFNARPGDYNYALAPESSPAFLDSHPYPLTKGTSIGYTRGETVGEAGLSAVSIAAIDRQNRLIALEPGWFNEIPALEAANRADFSSQVVLDPTHRDYLSSKVALTLRGIGNPPVALPSPRTLEALGLPPGTAAGKAAITPCAEVLWSAPAVQGSKSGRNPPAIRKHLEQHLQSRNRVLLKDQWAAFEKAMGQQLALIWGPPGTGKSYTLRAIVLGAVWDAVQRGKPLRLLISANTYTAVDNILMKMQDELASLFGLGPGQPRPYKLFRVQAESREFDYDFTGQYGDITNVRLNKKNPDPDAQRLIALLDDPKQEVVVAGVPTQQVHNLSIAGKSNPAPKHTQREWFDLILLDEATQVDVATSTLVLSKRAPGGTCVLGGDYLQLPPIHQADPPVDLEHTVGSIYGYLVEEQGSQTVPLNVSFRSNQTLVDFTKTAGYSPTLRSNSPRLELNLARMHGQPPQGWPASLHWTPDYWRLLHPSQPAAAVVYEDRRSAQSNPFEAEVTAALVWLLRHSLLDGLLNENGPDGRPLQRAAPSALYGRDEFWDKGVGIVVPHRAQMSTIIGRLQALFPTDPPEKIRSAVDTVERFQGQERDVVFGSFGLGDPDIIRAEEEFLYDLRRFNVMASRARAKLIVLTSRSLVEHLSNDTDVLQESLLVKRFVEQFCHAAGKIGLPNGQGNIATCELRVAP